MDDREWIELQHKAAVLKEWTGHESYRIVMEQFQVAEMAATERAIQGATEDVRAQARGAVIALREAQRLPEMLMTTEQAIRRNRRPEA